MEPTLYKELSYKVQGFRLVSWLIAAVTLLLILLVGIGCYILVVGMNGKQETTQRERVTIIEGEIQDPFDAIVVPGRFAHGRSRDSSPEASEIQPEAIPPPSVSVHPHNYKTSFSSRYPIETDGEQPSQKQPQNDAVLDALSKLTSRSSDMLENFEDRPSQQYMEHAIKMLDDYASQMEAGESHHNRQKRSPLVAGLLGYLPYVSYASFGQFMYSQLTEIAQYRLESRSFQSRKLGGDPVSQFLDGDYWNTPYDKPSVVKKDSAFPEQKDDDEDEHEQPQPHQQAPVQSQQSFGWQPMVNQVPLSFVAEILRSLLNLIKAFLMKDNVMECLWFMFCQDVNHQAKYTDMYGILARVNSVGLKVLTEKELRSRDTFSDVFRAVTSWAPLQCDSMFPKCDGPRALEIVNEVALAN